MGSGQKHGLIALTRSPLAPRVGGERFAAMSTTLLFLVVIVANGSSIATMV